MGSEINARMCVMFSVQNVNTKSTANWWVDIRGDESVWAKNTEAADSQKNRLSIVCHRHQQNSSIDTKKMHRWVWWLCWKVGYNLENKVFLALGPFVNFLWRMDHRRKDFWNTSKATLVHILDTCHILFDSDYQ